MNRRKFFSLLAAAVLTPPEPVRAFLEPLIPSKVPVPKIVKMHAMEMIGISICNVNALQKATFTS